MKKVTTELTKESVNVTIEAEGYDNVCVVLPVALVSPQISLQIASMLAADPKLPQPKHENNSAE